MLKQRIGRLCHIYIILAINVVIIFTLFDTRKRIFDITDVTTSANEEIDLKKSMKIPGQVNPDDPMLIEIIKRDFLLQPSKLPYNLSEEVKKKVKFTL